MRIFRASTHATAAAFSASRVCSVAARKRLTSKSSGFGEAPSRRGAEASQVLCSFASASWTLRVTSRSRSLASRKLVSFVNFASFWPISSSRACNWDKSSAAWTRTTSGKHLTTTCFALKNDLVLATAASATEAVDLHAAIAASLSSTGTFSTPLRKGPSASVVFKNASSAACVSTPASLRIASACKPSIWLRSCTLKSSSFFFVSLLRSSMRPSSVFKAHCAG
mmetsp:Transcript_66904/g.193346  ORF Transcript_66904/g.193346 Transcript_66904/m.193346 type:complete len:224 (-) Transcript_66904:1697-2368(-)